MSNATYKKLKIWQKAMELTKKVYELTANFPKEELFVLTGQIRRTAISIATNISVGSLRKTQKEFANFILISKSSLSKIETQFLLAFALKHLDEVQHAHLSEEIMILEKMLSSFHKRLMSKTPKVVAIEI